MRRPATSDQPEPGAVLALGDDLWRQRKDDLRPSRPPGQGADAHWRGAGPRCTRAGRDVGRRVGVTCLRRAVRPRSAAHGAQLHHCPSENLPFSPLTLFHRMPVDDPPAGPRSSFLLQHLRLAAPARRSLPSVWRASGMPSPSLSSSTYARRAAPASNRARAKTGSRYWLSTTFSRVRVRPLQLLRGPDPPRPSGSESSLWPRWCAHPGPVRSARSVHPTRRGP